VLEADIELIEDLGNGMNCLFVGAKQQYTRGHGDLMLRRLVTFGQVTVVSRTAEGRPFGCEAESDRKHQGRLSGEEVKLAYHFLLFTADSGAGYGNESRNCEISVCAKSGNGSC